MYRFEKEISDRYLVQTPEAYNEVFLPHYLGFFKR